MLDLTMSRALLEKMLAEPPKLHHGETEIRRTVSAHDTFLKGRALNGILNGSPGCYGIDPDVARFLYDSVFHQSKTLETGSGISTLVFALKQSDHTAITPNATEIDEIQDYAKANQIPLDRVKFVIEPSDRYLPDCEIKDLDLVLIDGKHAFPWPIIDWFYTADRLKEGGILVLDDVQMPSVSILKDFITEDPRWQFVRSFGRRTLAVKKAAPAIHDVAWHMQPYIIRRYGRKARLMNALGLKRRAKP
jgi:predicted O-methyltransferase YrrM